MRAVPINDNLSFTVQSVLRDLGMMDSVGLRHVMAASVGLLYDKMGPVHTAKIISHVMDECRKHERPLSLQEVASLTAMKHQCLVSDLRKPYGGERANIYEHAYIRHEAFWLARKQKTPKGDFVHSLPKIGLFFGGRDHSTVIHGIKKHEDRLFSGEISF